MACARGDEETTHGGGGGGAGGVGAEVERGVGRPVGGADVDEEEGGTGPPAHFVGEAGGLVAGGGGVVGVGWAGVGHCGIGEAMRVDEDGWQNGFQVGFLEVYEEMWDNIS